jgi:hypothetical protein
MPAPCYNCGKPAMYLVGPPGNQFPLCLECYDKQQRIAVTQKDQLVQDHNHAIQDMEVGMGLPLGSLGRYQERKIIHQQGGPVTYNNFHFANSPVGVVNTGNLKIVDTAITTMNSQPKSQEIAAALTELIDAVVNSDLSKDKKNEAIEMLTTISAEAAMPEPQRKKSVVKSLLKSLPSIIQTSAHLAKIWDSVSPHIHQFFP